MELRLNIAGLDTLVKDKAYASLTVNILNDAELVATAIVTSSGRSVASALRSASTELVTRRAKVVPFIKVPKDTPITFVAGSKTEQDQYRNEVAVALRAKVKAGLLYSDIVDQTKVKLNS